MASKKFFTDSMEHFRTSLPSNEKLVFLVASDDYKWCRRMFKDMEDVVLADEAPVEIRNSVTRFCC